MKKTILEASKTPVLALPGVIATFDDEVVPDVLAFVDAAASSDGKPVDDMGTG